MLAEYTDYTMGNPDAEQIKDAKLTHVQDVVGRAFRDYPVSAKQRWLLIAEALNKARDSLDLYIDLNWDEIFDAGVIKLQVEQANRDGAKDTVLQNVGDYFSLYQRANERSTQ